MMTFVLFLMKQLLKMAEYCLSLVRTQAIFPDSWEDILPQDSIIIVKQMKYRNLEEGAYRRNVYFI